MLDTTTPRSLALDPLSPPPNKHHKKWKAREEDPKADCKRFQIGRAEEGSGLIGSVGIFPLSPSEFPVVR